MTDDERIDASLRQVLVGRDPGPTPERLRARIAEVSVRPRPRRWQLPGFIGIVRPVVATIATAAAVIVGILVVSVVRPGPGASVAQSPGPGSTGAASAPDLGLVGAPLAIPVGVAVVGLLCLLLVIYRVVDTALERSMVRADAGTPHRGLRRVADRTPRRVLFLGVTLALLAGGGAVIRDATLVPGSIFQASLMHLEGMGQVPVPVNGSREAAYFRYIPRSAVTVVEAVRNAGHLPVTIVGAGAGTSGIELRLFAPHDPSASVDVDTMPTYPFAPIELGPGQEREIVIVFHIADCPGIPLPSSEPPPDLSGGYVPPVGEGWASVDFVSIGLDYSVLGLAQETTVPFFETVIIRSPNGTICDLDQEWGQPSPSPR